jgi:hypothetical protein
MVERAGKLKGWLILFFNYSTSQLINIEQLAQECDAKVFN